MPQPVRSYEIASLNDFKIVSEDSKHYIVNCPYCPTKYKPNKENFYPKLYIHKQKLVGFCFRCNTVVLLNDKNKIYISKSVNEIIKLQGINLPLIPLNEIGKNYISSRSPYILELPDLDIYQYNNTGILFPVRIDGVIYSYQIRWFYGDPKYFNMPGSKLLWKHRGLNLKKTDVLTLCEGVFDALGLEYIGFPNPIASFGKSLSKLQIELLSYLRPKLIILAYDDVEISQAVYKQISKIPSVNATNIIEFNEKDPDEYSTKIWKMRQIK